MIYAVLDTNVLVSYMLAKQSDSKVVKCVDLVRRKSIIPLYNDVILREYDEVLHREHFGFDENKIADLINLFNINGINCERKAVNEIFPDPDDAVFYEVAMSRDDSYLVTGNLKHFPKNGRVVSPAEMLQIIEFGGKPVQYLSDVEAPEYLPMTIDEINAIIREVREEMRARKDL